MGNDCRDISRMIFVTFCAEHLQNGNFCLRKQFLVFFFKQNAIQIQIDGVKNKVNQTSDHFISGFGAESELRTLTPFIIDFYRILNDKGK